jgi:LacI family transcriptional regulator
MRTRKQSDAMEKSDRGMACPFCGSSERQVKAGTHKGKQRYKCQACDYRYTPDKSVRGVGEEVRERARLLAGEGRRVSAIARELNVSSQSVLNWLKQTGAPPAVPAGQVPEREDAPPRQDTAVAVKRKPTIADVADLSGVSVASVSNYLNGKGNLRDRTRDRIRAAIDELHFAPSALMRGILNRRTHILGVMMFDLNSLGSDVGTAVAPQLLAGMSAAAYEAGHHILLYTGLRYENGALEGSEFLNGTIDGMIWVAREVPEPALGRLAAAGLPTVAVLDRRAPDAIGFVDGDDIQGMCLLVRHLAELGHTRIAYVGSLHSSNFQDRAEGYRKGLQRTGLPYDQALDATGDQFRRSRDEYAAVIDRWLALSSPPTAIMVQNDRWAAHVIEMLKERGLRVPEDMAVTGFDDAPDARWIGGGLTTVRQPFGAMGSRAVTSVIDLIHGAPVADCRVTMPVELVIRSSTAGR